MFEMIMHASKFYCIVHYQEPYDSSSGNITLFYFFRHFRNLVFFKKFYTLNLKMCLWTKKKICWFERKLNKEENIIISIWKEIKYGRK